MKPIDFPQRNVMLAEDQPEYQTLPALLRMHEVIVPPGPGDPKLAICTKSIPWDYTVVFELSEQEITEIVANKKFFYRQSVFGGSFQPMFFSTKDPFIEDNKQHWPQ